MHHHLFRKTFDLREIHVAVGMIVLKLLHVPCVLSRVGRSQEQKRDWGVGWRNDVGRTTKHYLFKNIVMVSNTYID